MVALGGTILIGPHGGRDEASSGTARVNGEIAVTRSLGDHSLKPLLTAEPHIEILSVFGIVPFDFLVVATDGLWDVMENHEVIAYVKERRKEIEGIAGGLPWQTIATMLTHEALLRGSLDNIGVCIIDLKRAFSSPNHSGNE